nr:reverse transcriptase domain-containing protein [Tanacetum cinerariifolium]
MTDEAIRALIAQGVADALAEHKANRSIIGDDSHDLGSDRRRRMPVARTDELSYNQRFQELALMYGRMFLEESDEVEKYVGGLPDKIQGSVMASKPKIMQDAIEFAIELMDQKIPTFAARQLKTKGNLTMTTKLNNNLPKSKMWKRLILLGLLRRRSMLGLYHCARSENFTTMAHAL